MNRLKGLELRFNVEDNHELNTAIRMRLRELGAEGEIHVLGFRSIYFNGSKFWGFSANQYEHATISTLDDLYHLPKTHTITIDGKDIELSAESFNELKAQLT